ncbi:MAG: radical SAM protein [Planctomycetaceae bacterium]|nr:radical SAM protein [Planctomycetaceae bacterium]
MSSGIEKFIWDLTYACPLLCAHCYSESGRRPARVLGREEAMRVIDVILAARPSRVSISGGEPLIVPWCLEAVKRIHEAGVVVTLFTSGWVLNEASATELATSVATVAVSVDGPEPGVHDAIRRRPGAFDRALAALDLLLRVKKQRRAAGLTCCTIGIDYTLTRSGSNLSELERFVGQVTSKLAGLDFVRFGAVVPTGLAAEEGFEATDMLSVEELVGILDEKPRLAAAAHNGTEVSVTDVRYFLPQKESDVTAVRIAQLEPDGALRAFPIYEAKVGNVLQEPLDVLWERAMAWRTDSFVAAQLNSIRTMEDWARATRTLDRKYGSADDRARIALRTTTPT